MNRKIQNHSLQMESLEDRKLMTTVTELGGTAITGDAVAVSGHAIVCTSYDNDHNSSRSNNGIVGEGVDNVDDSTESRSGDTNKLSIGAGTKAILNGSVRGDLVNNGMLVVNGNQMDSFFDVFTELSIAEEPQGSNPTPHPLPVPEFLDACFKDQLEHGPGPHETRPDGLDTGPVTSGPAAEVKLDTGPIGTAPSSEVKLDTGPINQLEQRSLLSAAAVLEPFAPEAGKATDEKLNLTASFGNTASELPNETETPAPMESNSGNGTNSLGGGNEDELEQPGELPEGNQPADNAGAGSPSDLFTMPLDPNGDTSRILADGEDDNKEDTEDVDDAKDDEVDGWDIFVSWLTSFLPGGTTLSGLETGAQGVTNVHKYIGSMNSSLAKQTGDDSYTKGN